jgi:hypothetical protein
MMKSSKCASRSNQSAAQRKIIAEVRQIAQSYLPEATHELGKLSTGAKSEPTKIEAIKVLFDRGLGRPTQPLPDDLEQTPAKIVFQWDPTKAEERTEPRLQEQSS